MYKYLPSKRFILILISIILALGIVFGYLAYRDHKIDSLKSTEINNQIKSQKILTLDFDNDGLPDWEEALFKTDTKKADTDGDGTNDGDEIKAGRDPLKANTAGANQEQNDKKAEKLILQNNNVEDTSKLTATEKISRSLLLQYLNAKQTNIALSNSDMQTIVNNVLTYLPQITFKKYTVSDLNISSLTDKQFLRTYTNTVAEIILTNMKNETEDIDTIITSAAEISDDTIVTEQTKEIFKRFDPLIIKNKNTVSDLLAVKVPASFTDEHLKLLNSFQEIYQGLDLMQKSADDTITLLPLRSQYDISAQNLASALVEIRNKITNLNVSFASINDYGYQLFGAIMTNE